MVENKRKAIISIQFNAVYLKVSMKIFVNYFLANKLDEKKRKTNGIADVEMILYKYLFFFAFLFK